MLLSLLALTILTIALLSTRNYLLHSYRVRPGTEYSRHGMDTASAVAV